MLDLIVTMDDATSKLYSAFLLEEEGTASTFQALLEVFTAHGLASSLYTDRGSHYLYTPEADGQVDKERLTQVGRALQHLGIEHIPAYSRCLARYDAAGEPIAAVPTRPGMTPCSAPSRRGLSSPEQATPQERRPALTAPARGVIARAQVGTKKWSCGRTKKPLHVGERGGGVAAGIASWCCYRTLLGWVKASFAGGCSWCSRPFPSGILSPQFARLSCCISCGVTNSSVCIT
jgi:hypothetical protein